MKPFGSHIKLHLRSGVQLPTPFSTKYSNTDSNGTMSMYEASFLGKINVN